LYILDEDEDESQWPEGEDGEDGESNSWPPWPWPPWGDDDDGKGKGGKKRRDVRAREAAKAVVEFEKRVADASLDLFVMSSFCL
jgi:endothelin-converting enzyme